MSEDTALAVREPEPEKNDLQVLSNDDPAGILVQATKIATALKDVIEKQKLYATISGRKHVMVEGWTTLMALNRLQPFVENVEVERYTVEKQIRPFSDEAMPGDPPMKVQTMTEHHVRARAVVSARRVSDGVAVAQAEGFCSTEEPRWKGRDEYAIRSMAQTRGTGKVGRLALSWVMTLAGYEALPAEEVPGAPERVEREGEGLTGEQRIAFARIFSSAGSQEERNNLKKKAAEIIEDLGYRNWQEFSAHGQEDANDVLSHLVEEVASGNSDA